MRVEEIITVMERIAPPELAQEWDNIGLLYGDRFKEVKKLMVTLDVTSDVFLQAKACGADMLISHHPLIFRPLTAITSPLLLELTASNIAVYSAHTNLDAADGGVNDALAARLGLREVERLDMLRCGKVESMPLAEFAECVKSRLLTSAVRVAGDFDKMITKVGVLGGSGGDFIALAKEVGCDVLVTGEASYHQAQAADESDIALIAAGHFETEQPVVEKLAKILTQNLQQVAVFASNQTNQYRML